MTATRECVELRRLIVVVVIVVVGGGGGGVAAAAATVEEEVLVETQVVRDDVAKEGREKVGQADGDRSGHGILGRTKRVEMGRTDVANTAVACVCGLGRR